ncbi:MAG: response regulator [Lachnospiraceae bacterium]|nr:response regulator [Lachnospiraceae bacterium]
MVDALYRHPEAYFEASAIVFDLILVLFANAQIKDDKKSAVYFRFLLYTVTLLTVFEVATDGFLKDMENTAFSTYLINICNSFWYICVASLGYGIAMYFSTILNSKSSNHIVILNRVILIVFIVIMIINVFNGWVSSYDFSEANYVHGPLYIVVGNGIPIYLYMRIVYYYFRYFTEIPKRYKFAMFMVFVLVAVTVIFQPMLAFGVSFIGLSSSLGMLILYFTVETDDHKRMVVATEQLKLAREEADNANAAKSAFLADMSHEVRTPINALMGFNEMILKESEDEETLMYAQDMSAAIETLLSTVSEVLDISKIESGEFTLVDEPYHLAKILKEVSIIIGARAENKSLDFKLELDESLPDELRGDETRVRQIIINILNNAIKYTNKGTVCFKVEGERVADKVNLVFTFTDTGIGIKKEDLPTIFDSYKRFEENEQNKNVEGTGLGLSIVKEIVDRLGGTIDVESEYTKGSEFVVSFSQNLVGNGTIKDYSAKKTVVKEKKPAKYLVAPMARVLAVDDNTMNLKVIKGLLRDTEVMVSTADGGAEAIDILKNEKFDIVFLDAFMPTIDGPTVFKTVREDKDNINNKTPIVVITADALADSREKFMAMGFDEYISKPIKVDLLKSTLFSFLSDNLIEERVRG